MHRFSLCFFAAPLRTATITGKVVGVPDGDTIWVLDGKTRHKIRLNGIDAPEKAQPFGIKSPDALRALIHDKHIQVYQEKKDHYRRLPGKVVIHGTDANLRQLETGMAWYFKKYEKDIAAEDREPYQAAESKAKAEKLGLWNARTRRHPGSGGRNKCAR